MLINKIKLENVVNGTLFLSDTYFIERKLMTSKIKTCGKHDLNPFLELLEKGFICFNGNKMLKDCIICSYALKKNTNISIATI